MQKPFLKKITSLFLFFCLTAPFVGTYIWLQFEKQQVKHAIKARMIEGMNKAELTLLAFSKDEAESKLEWEHVTEFEYADQMFDVVESEAKGDSIYYYCWHDNEETSLNKNLKTLVAQALGNSPLRKEKQDRLNNFLKTLYCQHQFDKRSFPNSEKQALVDRTQFEYVSILFSPPAPPPELG